MYIIFTDNKKTLTEARKNGDQIVTISNPGITPAISTPIGKDIAVINLLRDLGIPSHIKGFKYFKYLFNYCLETPEFEYSPVTTVIYPFCANHFNTTPARVERSIRHAITVGFKSEAGKKKFIEIFGDITKQPVNTHFIVQCILYIKEHLI